MSGTAPTLFADAATARAVERARAIVVLVGSYDGSGNFGDIAQFDAALALTRRLGPSVLVLPLLEREYLASHRRLAAMADSDPAALFFDPGAAREDDLLAVPAPAQLAFGAAYLYGGGYLNREWGARKLAMLDAAETLLAAGGATEIPLFASGLQVDPEWIAAPEPTAALRRCSFFGTRDERSRQALAAAFPATAAVESGDDALGLLGRLVAPASTPAPDDRLLVNVHHAEHEWVSGRPGSVLEFQAGLLERLARLSGKSLLVQPLIAYADDRVDEGPGVERLRGALAERGIEVEAPRVLRPAALAELAPQLGAASLTVSCSYHVALTSLMLAVPSLLLADNPYYEQKAAGLGDTFGRPPFFSAATGDDPVASAEQLAADLFDPGRREALGAAFEGVRERLRACRAASEAELLARLGGAAAAALVTRVEELGERLRLRAAEPAELHGRIAELENELEDLRQRLARSPLDAELRAQQAESALSVALGSRSWRLTAPLRRLRRR